MDRCWAGVFRRHLFGHLPAAKLADKFIDLFGRPNKALHVVLGSVNLQQLHDLADSEAVEAVAFNIAWHYALEI